ncbi:MAG: CGNR zinc finger domain-containing protein [Actinomycetia bacterium]|nr:CGNR zinc finger domain-containing protein [Actinomycetes bacterium]
MSASRDFPDRVGGRLCLDFVNTVDPRQVGRGRDYLVSYGDVLDWFEMVDVRLPRSISWLRKRAKSATDEAFGAHRQAVAMREAAFALLNSSRVSGEVRPSDVAKLNDALGESIGHRVLAAAQRGGVREEWRTADALTQVLWPVAIDTWDLLTEPELGLVRQCPPDAGGCGWLFLDTSRAGNRRWCDMRTCGNRAKVRAHYSRTARR